jgi:hypothetical protein
VVFSHEDNHQRLRVTDKRVLRIIFAPKRQEAAGGWRNCILRSLIICIILNIMVINSRSMIWGGWACNMQGKNKKRIQNFGRKP